MFLYSINVLIALGDLQTSLRTVFTGNYKVYQKKTVDSVFRGLSRAIGTLVNFLSKFSKIYTEFPGKLAKETANECATVTLKIRYRR